MQNREERDNPPFSVTMAEMIHSGNLESFFAKLNNGSIVRLGWSPSLFNITYQPNERNWVIYRYMSQEYRYHAFSEKKIFQPVPEEYKIKTVYRMNAWFEKR